MKKINATPPAGDLAGDLHLFFGDEFLVKEQVHRLVEQLLEPNLRDINLIVLDGADLDVASLANHLFTPSLFGSSRVILVDQTSLFMGRTDQGKLTAKVLSAWREGDRKAALRSLGQLLAVAGLDEQLITGDSEWTASVLGDSASPADREALASVARTFFEEGRTVRSGNAEAAVEEFLAMPFPEGTAVIFTAAVVDKRKKLYKTVEKRGSVVECAARAEKYGPGLDKTFFDQRVRDTLARSGKKIASDALDTVYSRAGKDLRQLHSELEKLVTYLGDRPQVTVRDVEAVCADSHEASFFDLTNALRTADVRKCLPALYENLQIVDHPLQTLAAIASETRRLMVARELLFTVFKGSWKAGMSYERFVPLVQSARQKNPELVIKGKFNLLTMKDYPLYLLLRESQKFPLEKLIRIMEAVLEADVMMKSSRVAYHSPESILQNLVLTICNPSERNCHGH
jgi:DNA polymerase III subunit delta